MPNQQAVYKLLRNAPFLRSLSMNICDAEVRAPLI